MSETTRDDGGPAFPQTNEQRYNDPAHGVIRPKDIYGDAPSGMSLRDYFAAQALSMLQDRENVIALARHANQDESPEQSIARNAYAIADAMLAERAK